MNLGVKDWFDGCLTLDDGIAAARIIASTGDVDAIEVSQGLCGSITDFKETYMKMGITRIEKEGYYLPGQKR